MLNLKHQKFNINKIRLTYFPFWIHEQVNQPTEDYVFYNYLCFTYLSFCFNKKILVYKQ
ncbi:hypothetical protein NBRC116188_27460 [Oceaniserpentilla sp. 4NH20-0058]